MKLDTADSRIEDGVIRRSARHPDLIVDHATSERLSRVRQKDTSAEQEVRRILHKAGFRFRKRNRDLPGSPDAANRSRRWAVFVHGCFWHHHEGCRKATVPKRNRAFWLAKFEANRARDQRAVAALERLGYVCIVIWQCEVEQMPQEVVRRLTSAFGQR
jgi:DNA mismatch endonuclease (patch repair protein)